MKPIHLLCLVLALFLIDNTSYYWLPLLGAGMKPVFLAQLPLFLLLVTIAVAMLYMAIQYQYYHGKQTLLVLLSLLLLFAIYLKPFGFIDFPKYEGKNLLLAIRPVAGSGKCMLSLNLKEDHRFNIKSNCIGFVEQKGKYSIKSDTIFFLNSGPFWMKQDRIDFAVVAEDIYYREEGRRLVYVYKKGVCITHFLVVYNQLKN